MRKLKKYASGEAQQYISRKQALKKLQLSLNDFRRLCIIKGIYPREPKNRKRAQKGSSDIKILYHAKDIRFLLHEPIVWTLRDYKIFNRRAGRDRAIRDFKALRRRMERFPDLKIDHIVKERYPTFIDAIKDLDDCLTLLFLFSTFPSIRHVPREHSLMSRRLTIEFLHAVIASNSLRKAFISIKGYYFQAEIKGQKVTWIVPHYYPFAPQAKNEVDFKLMSIFVEFYTIMLGFVNFRLYHQMNLTYPPQFPDSLLQDSEATLKDESTFVSDRIAALNIDILKLDTTMPEEDDEYDIELFKTNDENGGDSAKMKQIQDEQITKKKLKTLFKGLKFFINREVPREPLVLLIRGFGGKVSWDKNMFVGATYSEDDETITHHIIDRPSVDNKFLSRDYIQPQWVFDCVNQANLLPTNKYFIGAVLPPHLSPFVDSNREDAYIPLEEKAIRDPSLIDTLVQSDDENEEEDDEEIKLTEPERDAQLEKQYRLENKDNDKTSKSSDEDEEVDGNAEEEEIVEAELDEEQQKQKLKEEKVKAMAVESGKVFRENPNHKLKQADQEHSLMARMVKNKHRNLYRKLIREERTKEKEKWLLNKKRKRIDAEDKDEKLMKRKQQIIESLKE